MDNKELAYFITAFGSLNDYGSTLVATKQALDHHDLKLLDGPNSDQGIFADALAGIEAIQKLGPTVDGIIAVNAAFTNAPGEDPGWPGHLRNGYYNEDDRISIIIDYRIDERGRKMPNPYFPPDQVTRGMLQAVIEEYQNSSPEELKSTLAGWRVFARLAKMQPFQDGNKRTALIVANSITGALTTQKYLVPPINDLDNTEFTINLMRYYQAERPDQEEIFVKRLVALAPDSEQRQQAWQEEKNRQNNKIDLATRKIKPLFRNRKRKR